MCAKKHRFIMQLHCGFDVKTLIFVGIGICNEICMLNRGLQLVFAFLSKFYKNNTSSGKPFQLIINFKSKIQSVRANFYFWWIHFILKFMLLCTCVAKFRYLLFDSTCEHKMGEQYAICFVICLVMDK